MELKDYLRIFHKSWILILACTLFGIAGAAGAAIATTPKYVANTPLYVSVQAASGAATTDLLQGTSFARSRWSCDCSELSGDSVDPSRSRWSRSRWSRSRWSTSWEK